MGQLTLNRREAGRLLSALRERHRRLEKGVRKFGDDFDPALGGNMLEGMREYQALIYKVQEAMQND